MPIIRIEKIVYPGRSFGRVEGVVCLTDEGLPGELAEFEPLGVKPGLIEGRTVRIIEPSPRRVPPRCAHYRVCGSYQTAEIGLQIEIKRSQWTEIFAPRRPAEAAAFEVVPSPLAWNYRTRTRFRVLWTPTGGNPAYNVSGSRTEYVPVDVCHLLAEPLQVLIKDALRAFRRPAPGLREIEARLSLASGETLLVLHWSAPPNSRDFDPVMADIAAGPRPVGIINVVKTRGNEREETGWGRDAIEEKIGGVVFGIGARSFFQVNPSILPAVIEIMAEEIRRRRCRRLADIYCGLGLFGLALATDVDRVFLVESDPSNLRFLKANIDRNGVSESTICDGPAEEWIGWVLDRGADAVVLDPPRKGLAPAIVEELKRRPVPLILYLACNPMTLARDLGRLSPRYRTARLVGFDFFPQTPHLETLAVLEAL